MDNILCLFIYLFFFFNDTATTEIYTLSLHDALPIFRSFEDTAFRLETRDYYYSPNESRALAQFVAGEPVDMGWFQNWLSMIRAATAGGRRFSRVRVVSVPLT